MTETRTKKLCAGGYELIDKNTGISLGRYGGREGAKWAQLIDGTMLAEDSQISVSGLKNLIIYASRK